MPDSLAHVIAAYVIFQVAAWRTSRINNFDIPVAMIGALIPDAPKLHILIPSQTVENTVGVPFSWEPLSSFWGILALAGIGSLLITAEQRRRVFGVLLLGAFSHRILDSLNAVPGDVQLSLLDMLLDPPTIFLGELPGLYISGDYWPTILIIGIGIVVLAIELRK